MNRTQKYIAASVGVFLGLSVAAYGQQMASATLDGKTITVDYTAPAANHRVAGSFHTPADLAFKGFNVPKGLYTFYVLTDGPLWQLAVNKATGQQVEDGIRDEARRGARADAHDQASCSRDGLQDHTFEDRAHSGRAASNMQRQGSFHLLSS